MNTKSKKIFVSATLSLFAILLLISFVIGFQYIKKEHLLFFANGTSKKAFLNATWEMSQKEVEGKNSDNLKKVSNDRDDNLAVLAVGQAPNLLNDKRIKVLVGTDKIIFGYKSHLYYAFFDDKLFRIRISGIGFSTEYYNMEEVDSIVVRKLEDIYGKVRRDSINPYCHYYSMFGKDSVEVKYWQYFNSQKDANFIIEFTYLPIFNRIKRTSEMEQNSLFK